MFNIGWQEFILIVVVAIIVITPKDLPQAIRAVSQFARQLRGLSREFRSGVNELMREAELDELKREIQKVEPLDHLDDFTVSSDPSHDFSRDLDPRQFVRERTRHGRVEAPSTAGTVDRDALGEAQPGGRDGLHESGGGDRATAQVDKKTSA